jgi:sec-independent protein translocase protein TatC
MDDTPDNPRHTMTLGEHLEELRRRILWAMAGLAVAMIAGLCFGRQILQALEYPYVRVMTSMGQAGRLRVLSASAGLMIYTKVALIAGLLLASPWIFYQLWKFVAAGLYARERRYVLVAVPFSAGLFVAGAMFYLFVVSVPMMYFLLTFNTYLGLANDLTLDNHIGMMVNMMLVFGLAFQLPLAVALLGRMGLVHVAWLSKYRRHVIVILLIFAAVVTSPSPVDQILLAVPMWLLFELGVLLVWLNERSRRRSDSSPAG